jgi:tRNA(Arg) A34 adenosine deaminase TadA
METPQDHALFRAERDALAFLGLLSSLYLRFDPPISSPIGNQSQPTHFHGLNVHALVIDNTDGEVLALEQNQIHAHQSPVEHGEQRVLRAAIARVGEKRPRGSATTVEDYYRSQLFYGDGLEEADFLNKGATIYTSLEPCPMCATTILVCRVKRAVFLLQDHTYGGAWITIKKTFYSKYNLTYGHLDLSNAKSPLIQHAHDINRTIGQKVENLHGQNVIDTLFFDHLAGDLQVAFQFFCGVTAGDLATRGAHNTANSRTLVDLKRMCNIPAAN